MPPVPSNSPISLRRKQVNASQPQAAAAIDRVLCRRDTTTEPIISRLESPARGRRRPPGHERRGPVGVADSGQLRADRRHRPRRGRRPRRQGGSKRRVHRQDAPCGERTRGEYHSGPGAFCPSHPTRRRTIRVRGVPAKPSPGEEDRAPSQTRRTLPYSKIENRP